MRRLKTHKHDWCRFPDMTTIRDAARQSFVYLVWPEEGKLTTRPDEISGSFRFWEDSKADRPIVLTREIAEKLLLLTDRSPHYRELLTGLAMEERRWFIALCQHASRTYPS